MSRVPVLILDDEPYMRVLLEQTLEELGDAITLYQAGDGLRGLELARQVRPKILFLDIMMPGMNGLELCRTLRADKLFDHTVIILLTARGNESTARDEAKACGANHYLPKPFDPDDIVLLVRRILAEEKSLSPKG